MRMDSLLYQGQVGSVPCRKQRGPVGAVPVVGVVIVARCLSPGDVRESVDSGDLVVGEWVGLGDALHHVLSRRNISRRSRGLRKHIENVPVTR